RIACARAELARREGLEDERGLASGLERALGVERDRRRRERKELLGRRALQLLAAEKDVAEPGQDSVVSSAGCAAGSASAAGAAGVGSAAGSGSAAGAASAGAASPAAISFCGSPVPTSALSFESSSST